MLYKIYVGSNNTTKKLEAKKAIAIASKYFEGFTCQNANGFWKGLSEKTLIIEIETDNKKKVIELAEELKVSLYQEAIAVAKIGKMQFV
ncbi:MAG TPA: hypothetical protein PKK80_02510 [Bacilli bacterium]|nr:hypothetical protein [Bacilli bacterium]